MSPLTQRRRSQQKILVINVGTFGDNSVMNSTIKLLSPTFKCYFITGAAHALPKSSIRIGTNDLPERM